MDHYTFTLTNMLPEVMILLSNVTHHWSCTRWCSQTQRSIVLLKYCGVHYGGGWKVYIKLGFRAIALNIVDCEYPERGKCVLHPRLTGNIFMNFWYQLQCTSSKNNNIPSPWLHTHRILAILVFPKSWKIWIHISVQIHVTIRVEV